MYVPLQNRFLFQIKEAFIHYGDNTVCKEIGRVHLNKTTD